MTHRLLPALALLLPLACSSGDPDAVRAAGAATAAGAETVRSQASAESEPAAASCLAESGIWTVRLTPATAATANACAGPSVASGTYGHADGTPWNFATVQAGACNRGVTTDPDGCAQMCTDARDNGTSETALGIESATRITGSAVVTLTDGTRCEYELSMTKE